MQTDEQLIVSYRGGNEEALRELMGRYVRPVYNFVFRYVGQSGDAEDIAQDVFVSAWKNIEKFDEKRKFKTWLFTIARNASLNWIKKKKPALFSAFENEKGENVLVDALEDGSKLPDEVFEHKSAMSRVRAAMEELDPRSREVLAMRYEGGFNFREIAAQRGDSINTVKSRHRRALAALRKMLGM